MVMAIISLHLCCFLVSVLALSSRFDGQAARLVSQHAASMFQYSLCRVVLMVSFAAGIDINIPECFSTRSVESF